MASAKKRPQNIDDLLKEEEVSPEEEAALQEHAAEENKSAGQRLADAANPKSAIVEGAPDWAMIPPALVIPRNYEIAFMQIPKRGGGMYSIVIWELSVRDEKQARARTMGNADRAIEECAKQMIRAIDGEMVSWGSPLKMEKFWDDIGSKYRAVLVTWFLKAHQLEAEERVDFFANRVVSLRSV